MNGDIENLAVIQPDEFCSGDSAGTGETIRRAQSAAGASQREASGRGWKCRDRDKIHHDASGKTKGIAVGGQGDGMIRQGLPGMMNFPLG